MNEFKQFRLFNGMINEFHNCEYAIDYYPKSRFPTFNQDGDAPPTKADFLKRNDIYCFKDCGMYGCFSKRLSKRLLESYSENELKNLMLCVIPASTVQQNIVRYKLFCEDVSKTTGIQNGFSAINVTRDKLKKHLNGNIHDFSNLSFDRNIIQGKSIILADDLCTSGTSFVHIATELLQNGAANVSGVFLGKTV